MSNEFRAGLRAFVVILVCAVVAAAFSWIGVVDAKQREDSERITKLEVIVPRIEKSLEAIAAEQKSMRSVFTGQIEALRRDIIDAGPHWGRALRPTRGSDEQ